MQMHKWLVLAALFGAAGCAGPSSTGCRDDTECPANNACVSGRCRPLAVEEADLAQPAEIADMAMPASPSDLAVKPGADMSGGGGLCNFNGDGVIDRSELQAVIGLGGLFAVNPAGQNATVSLKAQNGVWDFAAPVQGEQKTFDQLIDPAGKWWAKSFPSATYAQRLDANKDLLGVYKMSAGALSLLGVVSETSNGFSDTNISYATPIDVIRFPLKVGSKWTQTSTASGLLSGVLYAATDQYDFSVDQRGMTKVPAGTYDTLRLRFDHTNTYGFVVTKNITYIHMAECFGNVARIRSKDGETSADFTTATEYRRMATP